MRRYFPLIGALTLALMATTPAFAQITGSIEGTVRDATGAVLPGATITVKGTALRAQSATSISSASGEYRVELLPPGIYAVTVELSGFDPRQIEEIEVAINQKTLLDVSLGLAGMTESVEVTVQIPVVSVDRSAVSNRVNDKVIEALPLNGREFKQLITLVPGAVQVEAPNDEGGEVSIFGERPSAASYLVDGADNNDPLAGGPFVRYTQDSIQEFEVITTGYEAEFGRAQGGVTNIVTRSGTNDWQGQLFGFLRNDSLDSSNVPDQDPPKLERFQYGASLGGPIKQDKLHFFGSFELLDEKRGVNIDRAAIPSFVEQGLATPGGTEDFGLGPETDRFNGMFKLDWTLSANHRLAFSANRDDEDVLGEISSPIAGTIALPSAARSESRTANSGILRHSGILRPGTFLETTASWLKGRRGNNLESSSRIEPILVLLRSGFLQTAAPFGGKQDRTFKRVQLRQALTHIVEDVGGDHEFKLGWDVNWVDLTGFNEVTNDVEYSGAFLLPNAHEVNEALFRQFAFSQSAARFFTLSADPSGDLSLDIKDTSWSVYAQDSWNMGSGVTVNAGLRYDKSSLFGDDNNNFGPRIGVAWDVGERHSTVVKADWGRFHDRNLLTAAATVPEKGGVFTRNAFDVALPRLGVEYTDTLIDLVITSGFPIGGGARSPAENPAYLQFADDLRNNPLALYDLLGIRVDDPSLPPIVSSDNIQGLSGLTPEAALALLEQTYPGTDWEFFDVPGGSVLGDKVLSFFPRGPLAFSRDVSVYDRDETPSTDAFSVGIDQELFGDFGFSATYVHRRTQNLLTRRIVNLYDVAPGDPSFGQTTDGGPRLSQVGYDGIIEYDGLALALRKRYSKGYQFLISYTYSKADDNLLTGSVGSGFSNNNHPEIDFGPSNLSVPHAFTASVLADLPWDLRLSGIFNWRSGAAFSPRGIVDLDGDGLVDQRDTTQPRNSFRTKAFSQVDGRLEKQIEMGTAGTLSLLVEAFNLFNQDNVAQVTNVSGDDFGTPTTFYPGREIQIGVRYIFGK